MNVNIDSEQLFTEEKPKDYAQPEVLCHTFELLSNLHKLLPNRTVEVLHSYRSEEDKRKCMWVENRWGCLYLHAGVSPLLLVVGTNFLTSQVPQSMRPLTHYGSISLCSLSDLWTLPIGRGHFLFFTSSFISQDKLLFISRQSTPMER